MSKKAELRKVIGELVVDDKNRPVTHRAAPTSTDKAPAEAFTLSIASPFEFAAADDNTPSASSAAFELLARTGDAIDHWYWGRIVHDFAGMAHRDSIPVDYCHAVNEPIGYADTFNTTGGNLVIGGSVESITEGDEASKLIARSRRGIPYQASIYFDPFSMVVEFVPEGMMASVNGRDIAGPVVIARQWTLRGVAICPHGADVGTSCELADAVGAFSLTWKGPLIMSTKADASTNPPADAGNLAAPGTGTTAAPSDERAKFTAELKRFTDRFPNVGAGYFADGLDYSAACDRYIDKLSADLVAANAARDDAAAKLTAAQLSHGEPKPIESAGAAGDGKNVKFESMFKKA